MTTAMITKEEVLGVIDEAIVDANEWISNSLQKLGWSQDYLFQKDVELVSCPVNPGHKMPRSSLDAHMKYCPLLNKGYKKEELDAIIDTSFCYEGSNYVVKVTIDEDEFREVMRKSAESQSSNSSDLPDMPVTIERAEKVLSREQRLALHEYFIEKAKKIRPKNTMSAEDLMLLEEAKKDDDSEPKSRLELLAMQRDLKRRRQSYRAKNVHITKKSYTEVLREVIENQMEAWVAVTTEYEQGHQETRHSGGHERSPSGKERSEVKQEGHRGHGREERSRDQRARSRSGSEPRHSRYPESRDSSSSRSRKRSASRERTPSERMKREDRCEDDRRRRRSDTEESDRSSKKHKKHKKHKHKKDKR